MSSFEESMRPGEVLQEFCLDPLGPGAIAVARNLVVHFSHLIPSLTGGDQPRRRRRRASFPKKPSTAFIQEQEVGVNWRVQRGWSASQSATALCLWAE